MDEALGVLEQTLDGCLSGGLFALSANDLVSHLDRVQVLLQRLAALRLGLVREVDARGIGVGEGASGTAVWLRERWRVSSREASRVVKLAAALDSGLPACASGLAGGVVNVEQVQVIAAAVASLPVEHRPAAEGYLVGQAAVFGPVELARLGERLLEVVAPEEADRRAREALEREEKRAYLDRTLSLTDQPGSARVRISGILDREAAAIVRAALDPLSAPGLRCTRHAGSPDGAGSSNAGGSGGAGRSWRSGWSGGPGWSGRGWWFGNGSATSSADGPADTGQDAGGQNAGGRDTRTPGQRRADALVEICRLVLHAGDLPDNGGDRPQITLTIPFATLRDQIGAGTLDDGSELSAATARRMACDAAILPAILGSPSQILDVGQQRRLFTGPLRRALVLRDRGCAFPGCDRPPRWCDGHHIQHWADGGPTALSNAVLLCGFHHRVVHKGHWTVTINLTDGLPDFHPPHYVDPTRQPRRNTYHRRE